MSAMVPEEQQEVIAMILQRDNMRQNHQIIQRLLKRARTQLKCVIGDEKQRISGSDMSKAFVKYNLEHFQQPRRNRATAADGGEFCNGLQPYRTNEKSLKKNTYDILNWEFDKSNIKPSEVPFYNSIKCNPQPIEKNQRGDTFY